MNIQKAFSLSVLVLSTVLLGCKQVDTEKQQGFLAVSLSDDIELVSTKAPTLDQYTITIKNTEGAVVHTGNYTQDPILLDVGNYTVALTAGSNPSVAFDTPYYYGTSGAVINPGNVTPCNIGVKLSNAIISPTYNSQLVSQFKSYHTEVTSGGQTLNIEPDETRTLYVKAGNPCVIRLIGINALDKAVTKEVANFMPEVGAKYTENFNILVPKFKIPEQNKGLAWTKEFTVDEVMAKDFSQGNYSGYASYISYEYSLNGVTSWIKIPQNDELKYKVSNLTSNTTYYVRARIDMPNNYSILSENVAQVKTEEQRQVPNANMEDWKKDTYNSAPRFRAWTDETPAEDRWWATNNDRTVRYNPTNTYTCFPATSYTNSGRSGKGADLRTMGASGDGINSALNESPSNRTPGRLFIGDFEGGSTGGGLTNYEKITRGRPFASRPTGFSFWYKYEPWGTDARNGGDDEFRGYIELFNEDESIGYGEFKYMTQNRQPITEWTKADVEVIYTQTDKIATKIVIDFVSTTASSPIVSTHWERVGAQHKTSNCEYQNGCRGIDGHNYGKFWNYYGSVLLLDDIELTYEK